MNGKAIVVLFGGLGLTVLVVGILLIGSNTMEYQAMPYAQTDQTTLTSSEDLVFLCADDRTVTLTLAADDTSYTLVTPSGEVVIVREQATPTGERFENLDGNIIWQSSGEQAFLQELGVVTASECVPKEPATTRPNGSTHNQLADTSWEWQGVTYSDGESVTPEQSEFFILNFTNSTGMSALTDCNSIRGTYRLGEQRSIEFANLSSTRMFCEDSQEDVFQEVLQEAESWRRVDDRLELFLAGGVGTSTFAVSDVIVQ